MNQERCEQLRAATITARDRSYEQLNRYEHIAMAIRASVLLELRADVHNSLLSWQRAVPQISPLLKPSSRPVAGSASGTQTMAGSTASAPALGGRRTPSASRDGACNRRGESESLLLGYVRSLSDRVTIECTSRSLADPHRSHMLSCGHPKPEARVDLHSHVPTVCYYRYLPAAQGGEGVSVLRPAHAGLQAHPQPREAHPDLCRPLRLQLFLTAHHQGQGHIGCRIMLPSPHAAAMRGHLFVAHHYITSSDVYCCRCQQYCCLKTIGSLPPTAPSLPQVRYGNTVIVMPLQPGEQGKLLFEREVKKILKLPESHVRPREGSPTNGFHDTSGYQL